MADIGFSAQAQDSVTQPFSADSVNLQHPPQQITHLHQQTVQPTQNTAQSGTQGIFAPLPARFKELGATGVATQQENSAAPPLESGLGLAEGELTQIPVGVEMPSAGIELEKSAEVPVEVASWMQEVGQKAHQAPTEVKVVRFDAGPTPSSSPQEEVVVLPVNQAVLQKGLHSSVNESIRWLSEWCLKIIKKFHGMVVYHQTREK